MNPIVVMAVYGRRPLVEINLRLLTEQKCQLVVMASLQDDFDFLRQLKLKNLQIIPAPNSPLGRKWQMGVDQSRILDADPLIILGSDDFLNQNFIERACELSPIHDFICFNEWHIYAPKDKKSYSLKYKTMFPLGGGRVYSREFLDRRQWRLFDAEKERLLDDFAWQTTEYKDSILFNPAGMHILAVKGQWEQLNPLDKILSADSISWKEVKTLDHLFNFSKPIQKLF